MSSIRPSVEQIERAWRIAAARAQPFIDNMVRLEATLIPSFVLGDNGQCIAIAPTVPAEHLEMRRKTAEMVRFIYDLELRKIGVDYDQICHSLTASPGDQCGMWTLDNPPPKTN